MARPEPVALLEAQAERPLVVTSPWGTAMLTQAWTPSTARILEHACEADVYWHPRWVAHLYDAHAQEPVRHRCGPMAGPW